MALRVGSTSDYLDFGGGVLADHALIFPSIWDTNSITSAQIGYKLAGVYKLRKPCPVIPG
jgi:hypothetical protein